MTSRKHTRHFPKANWRVICMHFELSTCMSMLYTADGSLQRHSINILRVIARLRMGLGKEELVGFRKTTNVERKHHMQDMKSHAGQDPRSHG